MAGISRRTWESGPRKTRRMAWGYTVQISGKQERVFRSDWTREDAQQALAARLLERDAPPAPAAPKTFAQVAEEYLAFKRGKGKRSIEGDALHLRKLLGAFGDKTPVAEITAQLIAQYDRKRATEVSRLGRRIAPATLNRELATLRHLLRLAEEWGYLPRRRGSAWARNQKVGCAFSAKTKPCTSSRPAGRLRTLFFMRS